jgi:hypothetical protein
MLSKRAPASARGTSLPKTGKEALWFRCALVAAALLSLGACSSQTGAPSLQGKSWSGRVEIRHVHAAYIGSGSAGEGTLTYMGRTFPFTVGGLGIGGIGVSSVQATGDVYGLRRLSDFPGTYAQIRSGFALGSMGKGNMWMKNGNGVLLHLVAKRKGIMLSLGGDAMVIGMKR